MLDCGDWKRNRLRSGWLSYRHQSYSYRYDLSATVREAPCRESLSFSSSQVMVPAHRYFVRDLKIWKVRCLCLCHPLLWCSFATSWLRIWLRLWSKIKTRSKNRSCSIVVRDWSLAISVLSNHSSLIVPETLQRLPCKSRVMILSAFNHVYLSLSVSRHWFRKVLRITIHYINELIFMTFIKLQPSSNKEGAARSLT